MTDEVWLALKIEAWYRAAYKAVSDAGGYPDAILEKLPQDLIISMARNNIHLVYKGETE